MSKSSNSSGGGPEANTLVIFIGGLICFEITRPYGLTLLGLIIALMIGLAMWVAGNNRKAREEAEEATQRHAVALQSAEARISSIVSQHLETLANRRDTLVRLDRYGVVEAKEWNREVQHFIDNVVRPKLLEDEAHAVASEGVNTVFQRLVEDRVAQHCEDRSASKPVPSSVSPSDFEGLCAATFRQLGWNASTTKGSGDQGADVVAEKNGLKVILQCKLYAGTIGNKAVQEVLAAKHFYLADIAAVVAKTDFTRSAKDLAQISGVHLLHFSELSSFASEWARFAESDTE